MVAVTRTLGLYALRMSVRCQRDDEYPGNFTPIRR